MSRLRQDRRGLTLIEMMAVTAIIGVLSTIAIPSVQQAILRAKVARAIGDIRAIQNDLDALDSLPATLDEIGRGALRDPWDHAYQYLPFPTDPSNPPPPGNARSDRFGVPVNTRYDLYSMGPDGASAGPLTSGVSLDDVVRAADGGYIGSASKY
jgi:general secretion pathway protein G